MANHQPRILKKTENPNKENSTSRKNSSPALLLKDKRSTTVVQRQFQQMANSSLNSDQMVQLNSIINGKDDIATPEKINNTGLPDKLKNGIESLSGYSMDDVKVHYNSDQPAQLNAHAFAQGTNIHLAPGQEKHLPHEAWHVVQQKQGRVRPTMQLRGKIDVNDDAGLEREADMMGLKALGTAYDSGGIRTNEYNYNRGNSIVQRKV